MKLLFASFRLAAIAAWISNSYSVQMWPSGYSSARFRLRVSINWRRFLTPSHFEILCAHERQVWQYSVLFIDALSNRTARAGLLDSTACTAERLSSDPVADNSVKVALSFDDVHSVASRFLLSPGTIFDPLLCPFGCRLDFAFNSIKESV